MVTTVLQAQQDQLVLEVERLDQQVQQERTELPEPMAQQAQV